MNERLAERFNIKDPEFFIFITRQIDLRKDIPLTLERLQHIVAYDGSIIDKSYYYQMMEHYIQEGLIDLNVNDSENMAYIKNSIYGEMKMRQITAQTKLFEEGYDGEGTETTGDRGYNHTMGDAEKNERNL